MTNTYSLDDPSIRFCEKCRRIHTFPNGEYCAVCGSKLKIIKDVKL